MHTLVLWKRGESDAGLGALSQCHHQGPQLSQSLCSTILSVGLLASDLLPRGSTIVVVAPTITTCEPCIQRRKGAREKNLSQKFSESSPLLAYWLNCGCA